MARKKKIDKGMGFRLKKARACLKNKKYTKHLFMASFSW